LQFQAENGRLSAEITKLRAQNTDLSLKNASYRKRKGKGGGNIDEEAATLLKIIGKWGNHFSLFWNLVAPTSAFFDMPSIGHNDPARYVTPQNKAAALTAELYHVLPEKYHDLMRLESQEKHTQFVQIVCILNFFLVPSVCY
jgi:hypothetical protein